MADVIVGRFALIDLIAKGGSGSVWRAWDAKAQRLCAAKVLRQRDSADLMRFVREKGVSFDHPYLLTPYGWGAEDEHVVIAMPLVTGGTLESIVRSRGRLAEPTVVVILEQLLDGLTLVHSQGWIHRDVKPANLMFEATGSGRPHSRLADFGIAVHESDVRFTHVGMVNGTPGYMAPELFSLAEPEPSHDVYAAGVVALMALNGPMKLHDGAFRPEELDRYLTGVSPKLNAVLRRMLAARPEDRYREAAVARRDLPRVPAGYPLTFADGAPFTIGDSMPPLPPDAPGAQPMGSAAQPMMNPAAQQINPGAQPTGTAAPLEQARQGQLPEQTASGPDPSGSAPAGAPAAWGAGSAVGSRPSNVAMAPTAARQAPSAPSSPMPTSPHTGLGPAAATGYPAPPAGSHPWTGGTGSTDGRAPAGRTHRRTVIAGVIGVLVALLLGIAVSVLLVRTFAPGAAGAVETPAQTVAAVSGGDGGASLPA